MSSMETEELIKRKARQGSYRRNRQIGDRHEKSEDFLWSQNGQTDRYILEKARAKDDALHFIIVCTDMQCEPRAAIARAVGFLRHLFSVVEVRIGGTYRVRRRSCRTQGRTESKRKAADEPKRPYDGAGNFIIDQIPIQAVYASVETEGTMANVAHQRTRRDKLQRKQMEVRICPTIVRCIQPKPKNEAVKIKLVMHIQRLQLEAT
ncbi:hypothetical protein B0H13DRAFT_1906937 [Mycena leptocephala]|nr:hypothetical protein B0H13DRAFT_1906937 [Mycena leptocephala]